MWTYKQQSIVCWKTIIQLDKAIFETRKQGRVYMIYYINKKACPIYIKLIYYSRRTSVIIQGALRQDQKSLLIFREKKLEHKDIYS